MPSSAAAREEAEGTELTPRDRRPEFLTGCFSQIWNIGERGRFTLFQGLKNWAKFLCMRPRTKLLTAQFPSLAVNM